MTRRKETVQYQGTNGEDLSRSVTLILTSQDPAHLAQFAEYEVLLDGIVIGTVTASASTRYNDRLGRRVVTDRTWTPCPGFGKVGTRREALRDLLRALDYRSVNSGGLRDG